jgi:hypothetical protein
LASGEDEIRGIKHRGIGKVERDLGSGEIQHVLVPDAVMAPSARLVTWPGAKILILSVPSVKSVMMSCPSLA